jgi:hypothetical protein
MDEHNDDIKSALSQLEPDAGGDVQLSIAISLKKISDRLLSESPKSPPQVLHRTIERRE